MGAGPAAASGLVRRQFTLAPGSQLAGTASSGGELWFVIAGRGRLDTGGGQAAVGPDTGVWIPPGLTYRLGADQDVLLDAVALPPAEEPGPDGPPADPPRVCLLGDCEVEQTGDRRFRVLLGPGRGCAAATQFVGEIPPGRAPEHRHPYDETVLILRGRGVAHAGGTDLPLAPGTRVHLPRGLPHCLENTGPATLVVLGVFHPGGSPAAKEPGR
jgi:mannose-6-phosphate isomerase-like protein (cupin superfamily)